MWRKLLCLLTAVILGLVMAGCGAKTPQELPFETMEQVNQTESIKQWEGKEPRLLIVASSEEVEEAGQFVTDEALSALSRLDFTTHFAIIAFRGLQPNIHKGFRVERIVRQRHEVALYAQAGRLGFSAVVSSPYHLIKVRKEGKWGEVFSFKLYFGEDEVAAQQPSSAQSVAPYPPPGTPPPPPVATATPMPISPMPNPSPSSEWAQQALRYVAERYNVPLESLLVVNEHERRYPLTGRTFRAFVVLDTGTPESPAYSLLIDLATGRVEEDIAAVQAAEDAAYLARYGKLQVALHDRLQEVTDDTVLPVAIRVAGHEKQRTTMELWAELAAQFPEAAEALARGTKPMDVEDREVAERIWEAYRRMWAEDVAKRTQPLVAWLRGQGFSVESTGMPSLTATLPKRAILEIATRDDVAMIYLIEEPGAEEMRFSPDVPVANTSHFIP